MSRLYVRYGSFIASLLLFAAMGANLAAAQSDGVGCVQELEPNDTPGSATPFPAPGCVEGSLAGQDQDAFAFVVAADEALVRWQVEVEGHPGQLTRVDVIRADLDDAGQVVAAQRLFAHGTTDGRASRSDEFLLAPGEYVIGVSGSGGDGRYRVALEHAELGATVTVAPPRVELRGAFEFAGDQSLGAHHVAWELDEAVAGTGWSLALEAALGEILVVRLRVAGQIVREGQTPEGGRLVWSNLDLAAGLYEIVIEPQGVRPAPLVLAVTRRAAGSGTEGSVEREPNDDFEAATRLPSDGPMTGNLTAGDVDVFTFDAEGPLAEQLHDLVVETDVVVDVELFDGERRLLQRRRGAGGALRSLLLEPGTYYFRIAGGPGAYRVEFRLVGSPEPGVEREPNDTAASAQPLGADLTMRGHLTHEDVDTFSFEVPAEGARYRVQAVVSGGGLERLTLATADGRTVESVMGGDGRARIDDVSLPAGTYLVTLTGRDAGYALRLLDLGEVAALPPVLEARTDDDETLRVRTVDEPEARAPSGVESQTGPQRPPAVATPDPCRPSPPDDATGLVTMRYEDEDHLACGEHFNTVVDGAWVALDPEAASFRFIWVAASGRGTVIKIDTDAGEVVGEYWTGPIYDPERPSLSPSRSVVDRDGNAWIGNRSDELDRQGSVVKVGLLENGQCEDRNGNGIVDTSTGLGDVRGWSNAGDADTMGGVATAEDECILQYVRVHSFGVRHLSIDQNGDVWVSGTSNRHWDLIDGRTGTILRSERSLCGGYGGLIDRAGVIWSARSAMRWDPSEPHDRSTVLCGFGPSYGIGLDYDDHVWISDFRRGVCRYDPSGALEVCFDAGAGVGTSRGVAVTPDNHVWLVHTSGSSVTRFTPDGAIRARIAVAGGPTGVSIDGRGRPWVVSSGVAQRIDPATDQVDLSVNLDGAHRAGAQELPHYGRALSYTYSDMTGQLVFGPPDSGTYMLRIRGPSFLTRWLAVHYTAEVPAGASVAVRATVGSGLGGGADRRSVDSGEALELVGQYLFLEVSLTRAPDGQTPRVGGLVIEAEPLPLAPGAIAVEARPDLVASSNAIEVILDASGSMGQLVAPGQSRWAAATQALLEVAERGFPVGVPVALRVYGHLEPVTCHMALELGLEPFDAQRFRATVVGIAPKLLSGTPLADAILAAGDDLSEVEGQRMLVLVTDGEESCGGDPESAIRRVRGLGIDTVHIIGFALEDAAVKEQFAAWAELGGGAYLDTGTADELAAALQEVLQPEFAVLDPDGIEVARGRVNTVPVEVPSGAYRVEVFSTPRRVVEGVEVVEREVRLTVGLRE